MYTNREATSTSDTQAVNACTVQEYPSRPQFFNSNCVEEQENGAGAFKVNSHVCTRNGSYSEKEKSKGGGGVRVDVNGEVKLSWKFKKKNIFF